MSNKTQKLHVGIFSITDNKSALSFRGLIALDQPYSKALFWVGISPFDGNIVKQTMGFSSIELKRLIAALIDCYANGTPYTKYSGGKRSSKNKLKIFIPSSTSDSIVLQLGSGYEMLSFTLERDMVIPLTEEIDLLIKTTNMACYKHQQKMIQNVFS